MKKHSKSKSQAKLLAALSPEFEIYLAQKALEYIKFVQD